MSFFARDLYNMHRQMNSLFDAMHSTYGLDGDDDIDEFVMPAFTTMPRIDNGPSNNQQAVPSKDQSALTQQAQTNKQGDNKQASSALTHHVNNNNNNISLSLFPSFGQSMLSMSVDIHAEPDKYLVSCELPGVDKSSIDISADKRSNTLSIKAEKRHEITQTAEDKQDESDTSETAQSSDKSDINKSDQNSNNNNKSSSRIIRQERSYGMVQRSFRLSKDADLDNIQAKFENGVLKLDVPRVKKADKDETKKITIQ